MKNSGLIIIFLLSLVSCSKCMDERDPLLDDKHEAFRRYSQQPSYNQSDRVDQIVDTLLPPINPFAPAWRGDEGDGEVEE